MQTMTSEEIRTLNITKTLDLNAVPERCFAAILSELGPGSVMPDGSSLNLKLEPWVGGRWYRDLGNNTGHLWAHVQVIKPPTLLELIGPMFMSYPAISHVQYRLTPQGTKTKLTLIHRAMGIITPDHVEGVSEGWDHGLNRIRQLAEAKA